MAAEDDSTDLEGFVVQGNAGLRVEWTLRNTPFSVPRQPDSMREDYSEHILVATKFSRPTVGENLVPRPRLLKRLEEGLHRRLTVISAPAGYGKSTLVLQWLTEMPLDVTEHVAWLSLDEGDGDLDHFLRYVLAALRTVVPAVGKRFELLLNAFHLPPAEHLADALIADVALLEQRLILVLDDYHVVRAESVQAFLTRIISHLPESFHLLVLTREDPPWPLELWRVRGWSNEICGSDLSFSPEESRTFFANTVTGSLTEAAVTTLQRQTEGWPAGLRMIQLSVGDAADLEARACEFSDGLWSDHRLFDETGRGFTARGNPGVLGGHRTT